MSCGIGRRFRRLGAALAWVLSVSQSALAAEAGGMAQLREFVASTRSARAEFTQKTSGAAETLSGSFAFVRPGRFRWEVMRPYRQLLVGDAEKLFFYDPDLNQVTVRRLSEAVGSSPAAVLFGSNDLERSFRLNDLGEREGLAWMEAIPVSRDAGFETMRIGFRAALPQSMEVRDAFGRTTFFSFRGFERNPRLEPDLFRFAIPKGADVIGP